MNNKRIGLTLIVVSIVLMVILLIIIIPLETAISGQDICPTKKYRILVFTHIAIGILFSIFSLGFYLIFFEKGTKEILRRLEEDKNKEINNNRFEVLLSGLDDYEKKIMKAIKEQDGIEQNTLRLRTDLSSAKISLVLTELEKRGLIKKVKKGKTFSVFLKNGY